MFPFQVGFCSHSVYLSWIPKSKRVRLKVTPSVAPEGKLELKGRRSLPGLYVVFIDFHRDMGYVWAC